MITKIAEIKKAKKAGRSIGRPVGCNTILKCRAVRLNAADDKTYQQHVRLNQLIGLRMTIG